MHRVPLLELQRRPVIVSVVARLSPLCFVGGGICWGAQGAVSCAPSAYMTWVRPIPGRPVWGFDTIGFGFTNAQVGDADQQRKYPRKWYGVQRAAHVVWCLVAQRQDHVLDQLPRDLCAQERGVRRDHRRRESAPKPR
eukprot:scaffold37074_cov67-Phaeocystis_antarctica.AAC.1